MITAALLLTFLQPAETTEETTFTDRQPVRVEPLSVDRAYAAFRDVCVTGFPDPGAFDRSAAASGLALVRREEPQQDAREWSSPHAYFVLRQAPSRNQVQRRDRREGRAGRQRWQVRCDFSMALAEATDVAALLGMMGGQLGGGRPPREEIVGFSWDLGPDPAGGNRKLLFLPSIDDPRLFTLSLQRLADNPSR